MFLALELPPPHAPIDFLHSRFIRITISPQLTKALACLGQLGLTKAQKQESLCLTVYQLTFITPTTFFLGFKSKNLEFFLQSVKFESEILTFDRHGLIVKDSEVQMSGQSLEGIFGFGSGGLDDLLLDFFGLCFHFAVPVLFSLRILG
jgi:hypothetical protein